MATARVRFSSREEFENPNAVKVVVDRRGRALYFSRSPLPSLARVEENSKFKIQNSEQQANKVVTQASCRQSDPANDLPIAVYKHLGLYVYHKQALLDFCKMAPTELEQIEKLEQLRFLENGYPIQVVEASRDSIGVDTPEDLARLEAIFDPERLP